MSPRKLGDGLFGIGKVMERQPASHQIEHCIIKRQRFRIGKLDGDFVINPDEEDHADLDLDLIVAGTDEAEEAVLDAVRVVWASLWSDAALLYRRELALDQRWKSRRDRGLERVCVVDCPDRRVDDLTPAAIHFWHRDNLNRVEPTTANSYLRALKTAFKRLLEQGLISDNPAADVRFAPEPERQPKAIPRFAYEAMREAAAGGGWRRVTGGEALEWGAWDSRVRAIRDRLRRSSTRSRPLQATPHQTARPMTICGRSGRWSLECPYRRNPSSGSVSRSK